MNSYFLQQALLPAGWQQQVRIITEAGIIKSIETQVEQQPEDTLMSTVIPAMPNVHSHVFQRAMAGHSEYKTQGQDSFWSWRDLMYRLANEMDIDDLYQVAKSCYQEMLDAGYASVCEFHYVHRSKGDPDDYFSHSETILKAAREVGLPITFLPVLYAYAGVGEVPLNTEQKRFELSVEEYIDLHQHLSQQLTTEQRLGICFHSIRAVSPAQMRDTLAALPKSAPVHIHIAEQTGEVEQALNHWGQRPVAWLFDQFEVDHRWSLVHATHLAAEEIELLAQSQATAVICPLTEANLGDGIFPMPAYQKLGGMWAIGSDSHVEIQPKQELKMLEYSQRLQTRQRNVCCDHKHPHVATWMWLNAVKGGNRSSGWAVAGLAVGSRARVIELQSPDAGHSGEILLDQWVFSDRVSSRSVAL